LGGGEGSTHFGGAQFGWRLRIQPANCPEYVASHLLAASRKGFVADREEDGAIIAPQKKNDSQPLARGVPAVLRAERKEGSPNGIGRDLCITGVAISLETNKEKSQSQITKRKGLTINQESSEASNGKCYPPRIAGCEGRPALKEEQTLSFAAWGGGRGSCRNDYQGPSTHGKSSQNDGCDWWPGREEFFFLERFT